MARTKLKVQRTAFSVAEFCEAHRISQMTFYRLARTGRGPRVMKVGRRTLISIEASEAWRRGCESASTEQPT
ncbi:helix-turn-helix domain-containing protein [Bradyrhizobium sp. S3.5.5]|uniref:helix-turn-helix domain-containing protein n=1 Tax=Bradyrhizobium sp. S3.5.5 TaxID=3156430 RepID=UPI003394AF50